MRILSGQAKGRVLHSPSGRGTRPTDSRSREALFNILGERVVGARVLDLYAGTGAIGLEALSRGAQSCIFVEQNIGAANAIRANIKMCSWQEIAQIWQTAVKSALHRMQDQVGQFDIIFADPPFTRERELEDLCARLDTARSLLHNVAGLKADFASDSRRTLLIIQHFRKAQPHLETPWELWQERRAGDSTLSFWTLNQTLQPSEIELEIT